MQSLPNPPSFNLEIFNVISINFTVNLNFKQTGKPVDINTEIALDSIFNKKKKELLLKMGLRQTNDNGPFTFQVVGTGLFKFDKNPDKESLERLSTINCPAIMFPYMREVVADLTRRSGYPPLHVAPINFVAMAEELKARREAKKKSA